jgi:signal transduction histidine kinase
VLSKWPIRWKLLAGLGLLVVVVLTLALSGLYATYAYRDLVKTLSWRVPELTAAARLSERVGELRITLSELQGLHARYARNESYDLRFAHLPGNEQLRFPSRIWAVREDFRLQLDRVESALGDYRDQLEPEVESGRGMADTHREWEIVGKIEGHLVRIRRADGDQAWIFDESRVERLDTELAHIYKLSNDLPSHLHEKMGGFAAEVRSSYRTLIVGTWIATISAALVFLLFVRLSYRWILRPLRALIGGSRKVAGGQFSFRIHLDTQDEMAELAEAMNDMTARFQAIRDDLDRQVQERTKQVVRSEQLASVGFLAAGVAHEINNPLASIAMCAESLEGRMRELLDRPPAATGNDDRRAVVAHYLQMIQTEAFRCKGITEKLLDFSRIGPVERQHADLGSLVLGVIGMIRHLGKYQQKNIEFTAAAPVVAPVNPQEFKQVVLNLLTNALDSLDDEGTVRIAVQCRGGTAELTVADNGCGMEPKVLEHVFEPFFTRRRAGQQGTGLGLSISYRIVADHGGSIEAESAGPGLGSTFRVRLPLGESQKEPNYRYQAA